MPQNFNWLRAPSQRQLLVGAGYALVLAVFIGLGWRSFQQLDAENQSQRWVTHSYQVLLELRGLLTDLTDAETGERGFLITGELQYLEPYTAALTTIQQRLDGLKRLTADNVRQQARLATIEPLITSMLAELQRTIDLRRHVGFDAAATAVCSHRYKEWMDQLRQQINRAQTDEQALLRQRAETMRAHRQLLKLLLLLGTIACVSLLGLLALAVGKNALAPTIITRSFRDRYGLAIALSIVVCAVLERLNPLYGSQGPPLVVIGLAVTAAAWWGGLGPGLFTTALCSVYCWWALLPPAGSFDLPDLKEGLRLLFTVFTGAVISALAGETHRAATRQLTATAALQASEERLVRTNAELEQTIQRRTAELRATVEELEHFSYSITHDMRAPLRAMQSFAALLLMKAKGSLDAEEREYLRRIATAAARMDGLLIDALDFTKAMRVELPLNRVEPATLIQDLLETYPDLHATRADIRIDGTLPTVLANPAGLTQCLSNLLHNAVKFVAPGVTPRVRIAAETQGNQVRLWVMDNGVGIPPEFRPHLFAMFQRASSDYEGTGIGLALVRKVVQRMGGQVGVESQPGQGSRFWIDLPAATTPAARTQTQAN